MKHLLQKSWVFYFTLMIFLTGISNLKAQFQIRKNIHELSDAQKNELAGLILEYIDEEVVLMHCDYTTIMDDPSYDIHDDWNFLPFHRTYLERLEDWLLEQGHPEYVPLPGWAGTEMPNPNGGFYEAEPPEEFDSVSPACQNVTCANAPNHSNSCNTPMNFSTHSVTMPEALTLPIRLGFDLCDWDMIPDNFTVINDQTGANGITRIIEGHPNHNSWHNSGHTGFGFSVMRNFKSPAAVVFWLWHAGVDDKWKEWECNCPQSDMTIEDNSGNVVGLRYDLYMKDRDFVVQHYRDRGEEPNIDEGPMWISKDIWIRKTQDGSHQHENPEYNFTTPNYAYVQVRNRGCVDSPAGEQLSLYWTKAGSALSYPNDWNGTTFVPDTNPAIPLSGLVGTVSLPAIPAGGSYVVEFPWVVPNPADYQNLSTIPGWWDNNEQHFCLLAIKEDSTNDPIVNNSTDIAEFVKGNNNVVWKNISIVDLDPTSNSVPGQINPKLPIGATIAVGDPQGNGGLFELEFTNPRFVRGNPVTAEAEVRVTLDEPLWNLWQAGGAEMENVEIVRDEKFQLIIKESPARIKNLAFAPKERMLMKVEFNFLVNQLTGQENFEFDVFQREKGTDKLVGGERYEIYIPGKEGFYADAGGDQTISSGDNAYLNAYDVGVPAVYNWYNENGDLIYEGKDFTVSPEVTEKYKLEVITSLDGLVDYDEVQVNVKEFEIYSMSPNPASDVLQISYKADKANSAYFMIMQAYGTSYNHIIDPQQDNVTLSVANYAPGYYTVVLVADGSIVASENLIVQ